MRTSSCWTASFGTAIVLGKLAVTICLGANGADVLYVAAQGGHHWPFATWEDAATNIQEAVDAAQDGSLVLVTNGTYTGPIVIGTFHPRLTLRSVNGPSFTTIDGGYPGRTNTCLSLTRDAIVEGFRFINGGGQPIANDFGNEIVPAITEGGAVVMTLGHLRRCTVAQSQAHFGGGLSVCRFSLFNSCIPPSPLYPAITEFPDGPSVQACTIENNLALIGGGIFLYGGTIRDCRVANNRATPTDSLAMPDEVAGLQPMGGGMVAMHPARIVNTIMERNVADSAGGVAMDGGELLNCSIVFNESPATAGALIFHTQVRNCVIAWNTPENWGTDNADITHSCTWPLPPGIGNLTNLPAFPPGGTYHLPADSPCIDAGTPLPTVTQDVAGIPRPLDGNANGTAAWDMGAFEFIHATADSDDDGLSDSDEVFTVGSNPTRADTDADGMHDGDELIADTDPRDANSSLHITALETNMLGVRIDWQGGTSAWQVLEYKTNLGAHETWQPVVTLPPPTPSANAIIYAAPTNPALFYRLRAVRP